MNPTRLFVLGALAKHGPMYGHQLRRDARLDRTEMWSEVRPGSLYGALHRMAAEGLIEPLRTEQQGQLPARTVYGITAEGLRELRALRAEALRDLPDTPLFFGRLDYRPGALAATGPDAVGAASQAVQPQAGELQADMPDSEHFHVGRRHVHDANGTPVVIDWRAPVSRPFATLSPGTSLNRLRRSYSSSVPQSWRSRTMHSSPSCWSP